MSWGRRSRRFGSFGVAALVLSIGVTGPVATSEAAAAAANETSAKTSAEPLLPSGPGSDADEGTPLPPAAGAAGVEKRIAAMEEKAAESSRPLPDTYHKTAYAPRALSWLELPYNSPTEYGFDASVPHDSTGVRMFSIDGRLYDHPVAQAQEALEAISDYHLTGKAEYLTRAGLDAQRLIDRHVLSDDAWYFPYPFDFALHGGSDVMRAPWFSGMAQGQALSAFSRLYQITGAQKWLDAATATFKSFLNAPAEGLPSTVNIDPSGYLWLEEYPLWPPTSSDRTLNGHVFATFGLFDYQALTADPAAVNLWNGALAHTNWYLSNGFRNPGYLSHYCLRHKGVLNDKYHDIHWHQMLLLHAASGDSAWSRYADALIADYPPPAVTGTVMLAAGTHTAYKFDKNGAITASKSISLSRRSSAPGDLRQRVRGRGIYLRVTAGSLAGYSVAEQYAHAWLAGQKVTVTYPLARTVLIPAGQWSAYKYDSAGNTTASKTISLSAPSSAPFSTSATINGRMQVLVTAGSLSGYWLPSGSMTLQ